MAPLLDLTQSSVSLERQSEASGVNRAFFNLGSSLGTALAGAILIAVLISGFTGLVSTSTAIPQENKAAIEQAIKTGAKAVSNQQLSEVLQAKGLSDSEIAELVNINARARDRALRISLAAVALLGLIGVFLALLLPNNRPKEPAT